MENKAFILFGMSTYLSYEYMLLYSLSTDNKCET